MGARCLVARRQNAGVRGLFCEAFAQAFRGEDQVRRENGPRGFEQIRPGRREFALE